MLENISAILFVVSFVAPVVALLVGAFALAVPTKASRRHRSTTAGASAHV